VTRGWRRSRLLPVFVATQVTPHGHSIRPGCFLVDAVRNQRTKQRQRQKEALNRMSILWIILIVILVLALLGFFSRGYW
jgi:hypothetical protein